MNEANKTPVYHVLGLMSGTSMDGLDMAYCEFQRDPGGQWHYKILHAQTIPYPKDILAGLREAHQLSGFELAMLDRDWGGWAGMQVASFCLKNEVKPDFVASHGHTVFHQPDLRFTLQIGNGAVLAAASGCPVVCDFRAKDVALGGQGAPLVPAGDRLLFSQYDFCLNLGGFANLTAQLPVHEERPDITAFDICPCNVVLNDLAMRVGQPFDRDGELARSGQILPELLAKLDALSYYRLPAPKSLGREWVEECVSPLFSPEAGSPQDLACTFTHHIAAQITKAVHQLPTRTQWPRLLVSGGGSYHRYLIELLWDQLKPVQITVPDDQTIQYKEALIFAFLGVLRWRGEHNAFKSVTGALKDTCGGCIWV